MSNSLAVSIDNWLQDVLYGADEGLRGRNILQSVDNWYCYVQSIHLHAVSCQCFCNHHTFQVLTLKQIQLSSTFAVCFDQNICHILNITPWHLYVLSAWSESIFKSFAMNLKQFTNKYSTGLSCWMYTVDPFTGYNSIIHASNAGPRKTHYCIM